MKIRAGIRVHVTLSALAIGCASGEKKSADSLYEIGAISSDFVRPFGSTLPASIRLELERPTSEQGEIVAATGVILRCEHPDDCALFNPNAESIQLPIFPHCVDPAAYAGRSFDCSQDDSSFTRHRSDHVLPKGLGFGTASFIADNIIITAGHVIAKHDQLEHTYLLMNVGHGDDFEWETVDTDGDGEPDHLKVDTRYVLQVTRTLGHSDPRKLGASDWIILEVAPLASQAEAIPEHPSFCVSSAPAPETTEILVPSHPRMLPLKIADGVITSPGSPTAMQTAAFDVAGGSSGAPLLLASAPMQLIGINRGASQERATNGAPSEQRCLFYGHTASCKLQPTTPSSHFVNFVNSTLEISSCQHPPTSTK